MVFTSTKVCPALDIATTTVVPLSIKVACSLFLFTIHSFAFYFENMLHLLSCAIIMVNPYFLYRSVLIMHVQFSFVSNNFYTMIYNLFVCSLGITHTWFIY